MMFRRAGSQPHVKTPTSMVLPTPRRGRRMVNTPAAAVFYFLIAATLLWPFRAVHFRGAGDLIVHLGGIVEAANALSEGQFPVRVAPLQNGGSRYAIFQYYGNFPYTAAALIYCVPGLDPYQAWKLFMLGTLTAGGFFCYRCGVVLTGRRGAAFLGGAVFLTSPYFLTDLHVRGAFTELVSIMLLPVVFYFLLRTFQHRRKKYVAAAAVCWALLQLSHNVTYLYASCFFGLYFLCQARWWIRRPGRAIRLGAACLLHLLLIAWYVAPQFATLSDLDISSATGSPFGTHVWTTLNILLAPTLRVAPGVPLREFGLQIGWPALFGVVIALAGIGAAAFAARKRGSHRTRVIAGRTAAMLLLFFVAFWLVWSPVDFWPYLPGIYRFVQFTYRNLALTAFCGALLIPCGFALVGWRRVRAWQVLAGLVAIGAALSPYLPAQGYLAPTEVARVMAQPLMAYEPRTGGLADYAVSFSSAQRTNLAHYFVDLSGRGVGLTYDSDVVGRVQKQLPVPSGAAVFKMDGTVPVGFGSVSVRLDVDHAHVSETFQPGAFHLELPIAEQRGRTTASIAISATSVKDPDAQVLLPLARLVFEPPTDVPARLDDGTVVVPASDISLPRGERPRFRFSVDETSIVQLPVLYYPKLLRVRLDGKAVDYANVGSLVALRVAPGRHRVEVQFAGLAWANIVSASGWLGCIGLLLGHQVRNRSLPTPRDVSHRVGWRTIVLTSGVAFAAFQLGIALPPQYRHLMQKLAFEFKYTVEASRSLDPPWGVESALDGNPATAWAAPGSSPVTLEVQANRPEILRRVILTARQTSLLEAWRQVRVEMFLRGKPVAVKDYALPDADTQRVQTIELPAIKADLFVFTFSSPVIVDLTGKTISAQYVSPGYTEIEFDWTTAPRQ